jgi:hypothetical protein
MLLGAPRDGPDLCVIWTRGRVGPPGLPTWGAINMKKMMRTQLFGGPERARKTKERIARAQLLVVAAREQAVETAQQCGSLPPRKWRFTEAQRRRLAQLRSL